MMLTIKDVAKTLKLSESTIRRLVREGKLPAYRPDGKQLRFRQADIDVFVDAQRVNPGSAPGSG